MGKTVIRAMPAKRGLYSNIPARALAKLSTDSAQAPTAGTVRASFYQSSQPAVTAASSAE